MNNSNFEKDNNKNTDLKTNFNNLDKIQNKMINTIYVDHVEDSFILLTNRTKNKAQLNWNKVKATYHFIIKAKNPTYKKFNRIESIGEDFKTYINNKSNHINKYGVLKIQSLIKYNSLNIFNESEYELKKFERIIEESKIQKNQRYLFNLAINGSKNSNLEMKNILKENISLYFN